jgi:hypothetical protein
MEKRKGKKGRPKKEKGKKLHTAPLIEFLNYAPGQSVSWLLSKILRDQTHKDVAQLQEQLIADLLPLTTQASYQNADRYLQTLARKLDAFNYPVKFSSLPADKDNPFGDDGRNARALLGHDQKLHKWGKHQWVFTPSFYGIDRDYSLEKKLYLFVAAGLQYGELSMLRRCQHCKCFLVADEMRQLFCSRDHARSYYDAPERAAERVRISRKERARAAGGKSKI